MRRKDREVKDPQILRSILDSCQICRLALVDEGTPYIVPLNFGYDWQGEQLSLFFHCAKQGRKLDIIRNNSLAGFELDCNHALMEGEKACDYSYAYASIIGTGQIQIVTEVEEKRQALLHIMAQVSDRRDFHFTDADLASVCILRLDATEFSGKQHALPQS